MSGVGLKEKFGSIAKLLNEADQKVLMVLFQCLRIMAVVIVIEETCFINEGLID